MNELKLCTLNNKNKKKRTIIHINELKIGLDFIIIAGPCSVESEKQTIITAQRVKAAGANMLRGGAFKPRTSPYSFQGLGAKGLKILKKAKEETGLPVVTEVLDTKDVFKVCEVADILQVGSRSMQNTPLLKAVGKTDFPVLLKRGMNCTINDWLNSAEYILSQGNTQVILCERGIRTFETYTRFTLDLSSVPVINEISHLPIIVDPSHGTGRASLVESMSLAAVSVGADGLMIEVHYKPSDALSDKEQAMDPDSFINLVKKVRRMSALMKEFKAEERQNSI